MDSRSKQHSFQRAFSSPTSPGNWFREPSKGFSPKSDDSDHSMHSDDENHIAMETDYVSSDIDTNLPLNSMSMNKTYNLNEPTFPAALTPTIGMSSNHRTLQDASSKLLQMGRPLRAMGLKDVDLTKSQRAEEIRRAKEAKLSKTKQVFSPIRHNSSPAILDKTHQSHQQQQATNRMIQKSPEEKFFPALSGSKTDYDRVKIKPNLSIVPFDANTARNSRGSQTKNPSKLPKLYSTDVNQHKDRLTYCSDNDAKSEIEVIEIDDDFEINSGISRDKKMLVSPISAFQHNITTRKARKRNPTFPPNYHRLTSFSDEEDDDDDKTKSITKSTNVTKSSNNNKTSRSPEKQEKRSPMIVVLSMVVVVTIGVIYLYVNPHGLCLDNEFQYNVTGLENDLKEVFYGQHLAMKVLLSSLRSHKQYTNRNKPLVLSLHGWTGTGKNYASGLIAKHLFKHGISSKFIHKFIVPLHFPHVSEVDLYKKQLYDWILGNVTSCSKGNLFIFDEMDKIPPGLVTVLKPFLDPKGSKTDTMLNNVIFLFLSNTGGKLINNFVLNHYEKGLERESIGLVTLEELLHSYAEKNPQVWYHELVKSEVIDHFVPFLPLERSHVKQCIRKDMRSKDHVIIETMVREVADEMSYFPDDLQLFSVSGCKKVSSKVDVAMG